MKKFEILAHPIFTIKLFLLTSKRKKEKKFTLRWKFEDLLFCFYSCPKGFQLKNCPTWNAAIMMMTII